MPVALRITCDKCSRRYEVDARNADDVVDLSASGAVALWIEVLVSAPEDWHISGGRFDEPLRILCGDHAPRPSDRV